MPSDIDSETLDRLKYMGMGATGLGTAAAVAGIPAIKFGNDLQKLQKQIADNPRLLHTPASTSKLLQIYADTMKKLQNVPVGGVMPVRMITPFVSPGVIGDTPELEFKYRINKLLGKDKLPLTEDQKRYLSGMERHYAGFRKNPEQALSQELFRQYINDPRGKDISKVLSDSSLRTILKDRGVTISKSDTRDELLRMAKNKGIVYLDDIIPANILKKVTSGDSLSMADRLKLMKTVPQNVTADIYRKLGAHLLGPSEQQAASRYGAVAKSLGALHIAGGGLVAGLGSLLAYMAHKRQTDQEGIKGLFAR
jgi:hypothetical protein